MTGKGSPRKTAALLARTRVAASPPVCFKLGSPRLASKKGSASMAFSVNQSVEHDALGLGRVVSIEGEK